VYKLILNFSSNNTPKSPVHGYSQFILHPARIHVWDCPNPIPGPCAWPYSHHEVWAHLLGLSRFLRMASLLSSMSALSPSLVSSANLLRLHSIPSSRSLIKMLNRSGPSSEPWGTPLMTGRQLDLTPLTTTLWARSSSQFFTQQSWIFLDFVRMPLVVFFSALPLV